MVDVPSANREQHPMPELPQPVSWISWIPKSPRKAWHMEWVYALQDPSALEVLFICLGTSNWLRTTLQCHQPWLGNTQIKWRFIAVKIINKFIRHFKISHDRFDCRRVGKATISCERCCHANDSSSSEIPSRAMVVFQHPIPGMAQTWITPQITILVVMISMIVLKAEPWSCLRNRSILSNREHIKYVQCKLLKHK